MPVSKEIYNILEKSRNDSIDWKLDNIDKKTIYFLNAHGVNLAVKNRQFAEIISNGDYLLRDGIGVSLAFKLLGMGKTKNLNGTDLIPQIIRQYKDKKIVLLGSSDESLNAAKNRLESEGFTNIALTLHGFHDHHIYIDACKEHSPDIAIICMGMPRQEILSQQLKPYAKLIICAGGWVDFYSGTKPRAPRYMQKLGVEWLHRLAKEPQRLGKRYTIDILYYFYNIFRIWLVSRKV